MLLECDKDIITNILDKGDDSGVHYIDQLGSNFKIKPKLQTYLLAYWNKNFCGKTIRP
jgi:hypothetical protein